MQTIIFIVLVLLLLALFVGGILNSAHNEALKPTNKKGK
jgi:hypothetical protein